MKHRDHSSGAFTLVEVTLAIGIMAFSLVALLGLFNVGFQASRRSAEGSNLPTIIEQIKQEERSGNGTEIDGSRMVYFTFSGEKTTDTDAHYRCTVRAASPSAVLPSTANHLILLTIKVESPGSEKHFQISCVR